MDENYKIFEELLNKFEKNLVSKLEEGLKHLDSKLEGSKDEIKSVEEELDNKFEKRLDKLENRLRSEIFEIFIRTEIGKIYGEPYAQKSELTNLNDVIKTIISGPLIADMDLRYNSQEFQHYVHAKMLADYLFLCK